MFTKRTATEELLPVLLVFAVAIALSIKGLREPDLWWQIRTGEWILEHLQVPTQDVFSYTFAGANWFNIKWLSEVLLALVSKATGPEWVFLLQAAVTRGAAVGYAAHHRLLRGEAEDEAAGYHGAAAAAAGYGISHYRPPRNVQPFVERHFSVCAVALPRCTFQKYMVAGGIADSLGQSARSLWYGYRAHGHFCGGCLGRISVDAEKETKHTGHATQSAFAGAGSAGGLFDNKPTGVEAVYPAAADFRAGVCQQIHHRAF
jgi:hypothetical protein